MGPLKGVLLVAMSTVYAVYASPQRHSERGLVAVSQGEDFHAAWIPASYDASTQDALCGQLGSLQAVGFDRVYLDVWNQVSNASPSCPGQPCLPHHFPVALPHVTTHMMTRMMTHMMTHMQGTVYFRSSTMEAAGLGSCVGADRLSWATACDEWDGEVYAWFEYGLIASYGEPVTPFGLYAQAQGWILGEEGGFTWMDATSNATTFLASLLADVARDYPHCAGVQLDDHFAQPTSLVPEARAVPTMNSAAQTVKTIVREAANSASSVLSLSPTTLSQALVSYGVDWAGWVAQGYFDEYIPQLYRSSATVSCTSKLPAHST